MRGEQCVVRLGFEGDGGKAPGAAGNASSAAGGDGAGPLAAAAAAAADGSWAQEVVGCWLSLRAGGGEQWWRMECDALGPDGRTAEDRRQGRAVCPRATDGLRLVAVLERVQAGLLGATLSSFGITGLYITFVYGIGRFLRLWLTNLRLKIPYEDFGSTRRLVALCQDVYIARAEGELALEEELFYLLLLVYKSPGVLLEMTRRDKEA